MRCVSIFLACILFLLLLPGGRAQSVASVPSTPAPFGEKISVHGIHNAGKVSENLYRGAQPDVSQLSELKKLGITTIVDLRGEFRHTAERERVQAEALGMQFVLIPVSGFSSPSDAQLVRFFALFRENPRRKIFVHCLFGDDRTGVFVASYRIAFDHWSSDRALSEMLAFGFNRSWHPAMINFIRSLPDRLNSDPALRSALAN